MSFESLGLNADILRAIHEQGYTQATPVQQQAIPIILRGQDILAGAQTGTGKTAGFTLPLLELLNKRSASGVHPRALVLTPTRELAAQVGESIQNYGKYLDLTSAIIFGGVSINPQTKLLKQGVDIIVATPGRLLDHISQGNLKLSKIEFLVLDEADRMLDMGFVRDIKKIIAMLPSKRQNLLFSATFSDEIKQLASSLLNEPEYIQLAKPNSASNQINQTVYPVDKSRKRELISWLISSGDWQQVLVFTRTKHGADRLVKQLKQDGIHCAAIHGNKSQGARTKALADFKNRNTRALIATDIAARGLDIDQLPYVVNYELPQVAEDYVHRIGRTGRAGSQGEAISLVCPDEQKNLQSIERLIKQSLKKTVLDQYQSASKNPSPNKPNGQNNSNQTNQNPAHFVEDTVHYSQRSRRAKAANKQGHDNQSKPHQEKMKIKPVFDEEMAQMGHSHEPVVVLENTSEQAPVAKKPQRKIRSNKQAQPKQAQTQAKQAGAVQKKHPAKKTPLHRDENGDVNGNVRSENDIDEFAEHIKKNVIWKPEHDEKPNRNHNRGHAARSKPQQRHQNTRSSSSNQNPGNTTAGNDANKSSAPRRSTTRHPSRRRQTGPAIG